MCKFYYYFNNNFNLYNNNEISKDSRVYKYC